MKYKCPCPTCFAETGFSVVMETTGGGVHQCPKNSQHRFVKDETGFWVKAK